jgi:hypothetical protein
VAEATDFTLTVNGTGFTPDSEERWNGGARPTVFVNTTRLTAAISAADVSTIGVYPVTVRDPFPAPGGTETPAVIFHVVAAVFDVYLPLTFW